MPWKELSAPAMRSRVESVRSGCERAWARKATLAGEELLVPVCGGATGVGGVAVVETVRSSATLPVGAGGLGDPAAIQVARRRQSAAG